ncbi:hypothetical protein D5086_030890 [Populus alba]|uniref:Uncharacterized protein n=1 Tax=Populus alba TaxID=43335 RepID=A0ACC4APS3_POPAL
MATLTPISNETQLLIQSICASVIKGSWNNLLRPKFGSNDYHLITTTATVRQVLLQLSFYDQSPCLSWAFFKWIESSVPNYKHSLQSSWTMLYILTKHKHFKTAHVFLENIAFKDFLSTQSVLSSLVKIHDDPDVNSHVLSWLVIVYGKSKMTHEAIQVFEHMRVNGFRPHLHACTVLLNSLAKDRLTDTVWKIYKKMVKLGVVSNIHVYNVLLHACCKSGDVEKAEKVLSEMELKLRDANVLLNEMSERKIEPDNFTCNTLINAYCKIGDMRSALKVKDKMVGAGLKLDQFTYKALIHGFCKAKEIDKAKELLFGMMDAGFSPSYCTYSWLVDSYCKQQNEEAVIKLPDELVRRGLCVDVSVYRAIIRRFCKIEKIDCAQRVLGLMKDKGIFGDSVVYTSLAYGYWKVGKVNVTSDILDEMYKKRLMITLKIYRSFNASYASDSSILITNLNFKCLAVTFLSFEAITAYVDWATSKMIPSSILAGHYQSYSVTL